MLKFHAYIAMVFMLLPQASFALNDGVWCAEENKHYCVCPNGEVRYGANGVFTSWRSVSDKIACNNDNFGDPIKGVGKNCYCRKNKALLIDGAPDGGASPTEVNHPDFAASLGEVQCCHDSDGCTRRDNGMCISGDNDNLKFSFHEAVDACAALGDGWRICTRDEVDSNLCKSKGCAHDSRLVWATEKKFYPKVHPAAGTATCQAAMDEWCANNTPYKHARFGRAMSNANQEDMWRCYSTGALTADRMYVRMVNPDQKCSKSGATAGVLHPDDATCWGHWTRNDDLPAILQSCLDTTIEMVNGFIKAEGVLCSDRNELNDIMPTGTGVTAEAAIAACRDEPMCMSVESYQGRTDQWQFSSSCTRSIATPASNNAVSYFRAEGYGFMAVEDVVCAGRNELNSVMPTDSGVSAAEALAACFAEPTCIQVESRRDTRDRWQFSSSCTPDLATKVDDTFKSEYLSYFKKSLGSFMAVEDVACGGRNELNSVMPTGSGVSADEALAACFAEPTCVQVESYQGRRDRWQYSSSCTADIATPSSENHLSYFKRKAYMGVCITYAQLFGSVDPQAQHHFSFDPNASLLETLQAKLELTQEQINQAKADHPDIEDAKMSEFLDIYNAQVAYCVHSVGSLALEVAERFHPESEAILETAYFEWLEAAESASEVSTGGRRRLSGPLIVVFLAILFCAVIWAVVFTPLGNCRRRRRALSMPNWESTKPTAEALRRILQAESSNSNGVFTIELDSILNACKVSSVNVASWLCQQSEEELMHFMGAALCGGALMQTVCQVDVPALEALAHHG